RYFSDSGVEMDVEVPLSALTEIFAVPPEGEQHGAKPEGDEKKGDDEQNSGLVVDAQGLGLKPALAPRILDESGAPVYGASWLSADARKSGVVGYSKTLSDAKKSTRVGTKPLVLKAKKAKDSDIFLAAEDVKRLSASKNS